MGRHQAKLQPVWIYNHTASQQIIYIVNFYLGRNSKSKLIFIPFACSCNSAGRLHLLYPLSNILDSFQWMPGQSRLFAKLNFVYRLQLRSQTSNLCYILEKDDRNIFSPSVIWIIVFSSMKYLNLPLRRNLYTISSLKFKWVIS